MKKPLSEAAEPSRACGLCPRLVEFRSRNQHLEPGWFNGAVPSFGDEDPIFLIVGLAPGLKGANATGRPFTGDYAGDLLYATLLKFHFASGTYKASQNDGLKLNGCMITNAVRCVPPQNKPLPAEIKTCRPFLTRRIKSLKKLRAILALGRIAHDQVLSALDIKKSGHPFAHGARHPIGSNGSRTLHLFDSYHCSRYNTNTGRLTTNMFESVFKDIKQHLERP